MPSQSRDAGAQTCAIFEAAPFLLVGVGTDGRVNEWNLHATRAFGWSRGEVIGMQSKSLVPIADREAHCSFLKAWLTDEEGLPGEPWEGSALHRDGWIFPVEWSIRRAACPEEGVLLFGQDLSKQRRLQSELLESQQRYRAIVESVEDRSRADAQRGPRSDRAPGNSDLRSTLDAFPIALIGVGPDGRLNEWNRVAEKTYGWTRAQAMGTPSELLAPEAHREAFLELLQGWLVSTEEQQLERPLEGTGLSREGRTFPLEIHIARAFGDGSGVLLFVRDLSERRQRQRELLESRQRYQAILENIEDGYFEVDPSGKYVFLNEAFCKSFGYPMDEVLGQNYRKFYDPEDALKIHGAFLSVWETGAPLQSYEYLIKQKDGGLRFVEDSVSLKRDGRGRPVGFLGIRRDITERKLSEKAVRASRESQWRDLFERASDFVYTCDLEGCFTSVNRTGEQVTGYSREELLGKSTAVVLSPASHAVDTSIRKDLQAGKSGTSHELEILTKAGRCVAIEQSVSLLFEAGKPVGVLGIARDISARRRTERFEQGRGSILEDVARDRPIAEVLAELAGLVEKEFPGSPCSLVFLEKDGLQQNTALRLVPGPSLPAALIQSIDISLKGKASLEATSVFRPELGDAHQVLSVDIERHPLWEPLRDAVLACGWHGCWSISILSGVGEALGSLVVLRPSQGSPDREERSFLIGAAELASLTIEHRNLTSQLAFQAKHDSLTGLANRLLFEERLGQAIADGAQRGSQVAVILLDLDRFKNINDTLGHWVGDLLLLAAAKRFLANVSSQDTLARLGGDEFAIVMSGGAGIREDAAYLAEALLTDLQLTFPLCGHHLVITASIGIGIFPEDGTDAATLLRSSDQAMYSAKGKERGQYHFYSSEMGRKEAERANIESHLRAALTHGGFEVVYQPQVAPTGELIGLEALLRFRHPTMGVIPPGRFIPIAEECGLIIQIGEWVLRRVCRQSVEWETCGYRPVRLAVNVSALQFAQTDFAELAGRILAETGMPGDRLELELTETVVMSNVSESIRQMRQLRALGVSLAIDDFGTGYSSLNYLHRFEVDRLKIDKSFVADLDASMSTLPVVQAIIALARSLKQEVVAEGVETGLQFRMLRAAGCDLMQGYLLGRPASAEDVAKLFGAAPWPQAIAAEFQGAEEVASQLRALKVGLEVTEPVMPLVS
jgi:diguanylate cyclase (GGDEF)-like protein/PAS domain S-box-containing protein